MTGSWFSTLLLSIIGVVLVQANECVVGVIGENVVLPCVYHGVNNLTSLHISSEWRRGTEVMHSAVWTGGQMDKQNVSSSGRTAVSPLAPSTGNFSMELQDLVVSDTHNYSLHLKLHGQTNIILVCTVCLTVAVGVQMNTSVGRRSEHIWPLTITLCVVTSLLVAVSLGFQRKRERDRKRKQNKEDSSSAGTDVVEFDVEQLASHPETVL